MVYVRFTPARTMRARLTRRDTPYRVHIEPDHDYNPWEYDCYDESDFKKFKTGEYRAWAYTIYRACPEHVGYDCAGAEILDSLCGIAVTHATDLEGDYTSPYFIDDEYIRERVWDEWPSAHAKPLSWQRRRPGLHYATTHAVINDMVVAEFRPFTNPLRPWRLRDSRGISACRPKPTHVFETFHRTLTSAKRHADNSTWHLEN